MGVEDLAEAPARYASVSRHASESVAARAVHGLVRVGDRADHEGTHERSVVPAVGAGELEGELIPLREPAAPGLVPAKQCIGTGAEDEGIAGILAAAA